MSASRDVKRLLSLRLTKRLLHYIYFISNPADNNILGRYQPFQERKSDSIPFLHSDSDNV